MRRGKLSPAAYDELLLFKIKTLLQAAMQQPRRRGPPCSFEDFVVGLDVRDEASLRVFELLLYETSTRRPRKTTAVEDASAASTSTATTLNRRSRQASDDPFSRVSPSRHRALIDLSDSDSDSSSELPAATTSLLRPTGIRARRSHAARSPSNQQQIEDLFGYLDPLPSFSQVLSDLSSSSPATQQPSSSVTVGISSGAFPDHPTFHELWTILLDDPFPSDSITSFPSFLDRLNASTYSTTPLVAPDMQSLLFELERRDPAIPIRIRNAVSRRTNPYRIEEESAELDSAASPLREGIWRASFVEHLDGHERAIPVEVGDGAAGETGSEAAAMSFFEFARRRRAERRQREEEGGVSAATGTGAMDVDSVASPRAGTPSITVTDASTPATSAALSPPSGSGSACPSPPSTSSHAVPPPPPRTSASIAEAAFRQQRRISPLPSTASGSAGRLAASRSASRNATAAGAGAGEAAEPRQNEEETSLRAVFDALQRARTRREERLRGTTGATL
ncbi:hypothetical protein JCM10207_004660 [Rhodosporidiobolus poonsookiae]